MEWLQLHHLNIKDDVSFIISSQIYAVLPVLFGHHGGGHNSR